MRSHVLPWLVALLAPLGCKGGGGTPVRFAEACVKANEGKVLAIDGVIDEESNLSCEVDQLNPSSGHCRFGLVAFDGSSASRFTLEVDKGSGNNEVSLGQKGGPGLHLYDPDKVGFTDRNGKPFRFGDHIRVVAKIHVDPVINPDFPPSCSLDMSSLELVAPGTPEDRKAREAARGALHGPKRGKVCAKGDEITVGGVNEVIDVTGECQSVKVTGGDNQVTIEAAGRIAVDGIKNSVRWRRGLDGKPPKITNSGIDNKVEHIP